MWIVVEAAVRHEVSAAPLQSLTEALEAATFADSCTIGSLGEGGEVYLRCPSARHGVILDTRHLSEERLRWILATLEGSIGI